MDIVNIEKLNFDFKGHFYGMKSPIKTNIISRVEIYKQLNTLEGINFSLLNLQKDFFHEFCPNCGELVKFKITSEKFIAEKKCKYPKGFPPYEFEINIPSGQMVIANDLRKYFYLDEDEFFINLIIERAKKTWAYASRGLAHAIVGNTCPGFYHVDKDEYVIASSGRTKKQFKNDDEENAYRTERCLIPEEQKICQICTDLWWYSICDLEKLQQNGCNINNIKNYINVVKVTPGKYHFFHQYEQVRDKIFDAPEIYTKIRLLK